MKNWHLFFLTFSLPLLASETSSFDDILEPPVTPNQVTPAFFQIDGRGDWIKPSKLLLKGATNQKMGYAETDVRAAYAFPIDCSMLSFAAGYQKTWLLFDQVKLFENRDYFQNAYATVGGRIFEGDWGFQGEVQVNGDIDLGFRRSILTIYGGWGTYYLNNCFSTSIGFLGRSGIEQNKFWPVLGFDWTISDQWEIHAVYPTNLSVVYRPLPDFSAALTTRFINSRHRLSREEFILSDGVIEYRNTGEELALSYSPGPYFCINVHAGYMFRGDLLVENPNGISLVDIKSEGSFYTGASVLFRF